MAKRFDGDGTENMFVGTGSKESCAGKEAVVGAAALNRMRSQAAAADSEETLTMIMARQDFAEAANQAEMAEPQPELADSGLIGQRHHALSLDLSATYFENIAVQSGGGKPALAARNSREGWLKSSDLDAFGVDGGVFAFVDLDDALRAQSGLFNNGTTSAHVNVVVNKHTLPDYLRVRWDQQEACFNVSWNDQDKEAFLEDATSQEGVVFEYEIFERGELRGGANVGIFVE